LGIDFGFFDNAVTLTADYYVKDTHGMLMEMPIPAYVGDARPTGNVGSRRNKGVELDATYK
jgi:hypothetical protein